LFLCNFLEIIILNIPEGIFPENISLPIRLIPKGYLQFGIPDASVELKLLSAFINWNLHSRYLNWVWAAVKRDRDLGEIAVHWGCTRESFSFEIL